MGPPAALPRHPEVTGAASERPRRGQRRGRRPPGLALGPLQRPGPGSGPTLHAFQSFLMGRWEEGHGPERGSQGERPSRTQPSFLLTGAGMSHHARALGSNEPLAGEVGRQCHKLRQPQLSCGQSLLPLNLVPSRVCGLPAAALPGPSASFRPPSKLERKQSKDQGGSEATRVTTVAVPNITPRDVASQEAAARRKSRAPSQSLGTGQPCQSGEALATTNE